MQWYVLKPVLVPLLMRGVVKASSRVLARKIGRLNAHRGVGKASSRVLARKIGRLNAHRSRAQTHNTPLKRKADA